MHIASSEFGQPSRLQSSILVQRPRSGFHTTTSRLHHGLSTINPFVATWTSCSSEPAMTIPRLLARTCARSALAIPRRAFATKKPPPFPTTPTCPPSTCSCAPPPELPEGFEIDHKAPLNGLISNYAQHVLVCTGKDDWPSRIEEANSGDNLAADLRELIGPKGKYNDVRPFSLPHTSYSEYANHLPVVNSPSTTSQP